MSLWRGCEPLQVRIGDGVLGSNNNLSVGLACVTGILYVVCIIICVSSQFPKEPC
jgi:hypothetical protein